VLRRTVLHASPLVEVATVSCDAVRTESAEPETASTFALVLVRRGCFYRRINGDSPLLDATSAYFQHPDDEQIINHPCDGGDVCTVITFSPEIVPDEASEARAGFARIPTLRVVDALHRQLLAACSRAIDDSELLDATFRLADRLLQKDAVGATTRSRASAASRRQRRLADDAREILNRAPATTLIALGRELAVSPRHLSRLFHAHTGITLARYRNELRTRTALEAVATGAPSLSRLAVELGFADHAHLSRTVHRLTGQPPSVHAKSTTGLSSG
jgi:AraC-like DNA-binding protein